MANRSNEKIIELRKIFAAYHSKNVLENIDFIIRKNDFIALIGPNGGGKTTLLNLIMGLHPIKSGKLIYSTKNIKKIQKKFAYVPQHNQFKNDFPIRVIEAISLAYVSSMVPFFRISTAQKSIVKKTMVLLGIEDLANRPVNELSGGQMQRVLIARALVIEPKLLLLDEPLAHLDNETTISLIDVLKTINKKCAIVMTTHDTGALPDCFLAIACLNKKLHYHGSPKLTKKRMKQLYGDNVGFITHEIPHLVLPSHE